MRPRTVEASFEADAVPLPTLLTEEELAAARLIEMDVEGGEAAAVRRLAPVLNGLRNCADYAGTAAGRRAAYVPGLHPLAAPGGHRVGSA